MKKFIVLLVAGGLIMASCARSGGNETTSSEPTTGTTESEAPPAKPTTGSTTMDFKPDQTKKLKSHPLLGYFRPAVNNEMFSTCHSEKSAFDDYENGQVIPAEMVEKYKLYKFNMSPIVQNKYRFPNAAVTVKGGEMLTYKNHRILTYAVGIGMESAEAPADEGVDIRALILNDDGELTANYFLGGYVHREGREEQTLCRKATFRGDEMVLTIVPGVTINEPSHLRLKPEETRDLAL